jgi:hypothetical protein
VLALAMKQQLSLQKHPYPCSPQHQLTHYLVISALAMAAGMSEIEILAFF